MSLRFTLPVVANLTAMPQRLGRSGGIWVAAKSNFLKTDTSSRYVAITSSIMAEEKRRALSHLTSSVYIAALGRNRRFIAHNYALCILNMHYVILPVATCQVLNAHARYGNDYRETVCVYHTDVDTVTAVATEHRRNLSSCKAAQFYMSTPRSTDPKAWAAASLLSGRLRQCWEATFDWDLLPRGLRQACYKNNML